MSTPSPARRLWSNHRFNRLWTSYAVSSLGDAFSAIALPFLVLGATGSLFQMGLVTAVIGAAQLASGLVGGPIVDRADPRRLMVGCHLACAALYGLVPITWAFGGFRLWLVLVVCGVGTFLNHIFQLANVAATSRVVDADQLTLVNGRHQGTIALSYVVGFVIAGLVSDRFGPATSVGVNGVLLLVSAVQLSFAKLDCSAADQPAALEPTNVPHEKGLKELVLGARFLWDDPVLRWVVVVDGGCILAATAALDLLIFRLKEQLGQDDGAIGVVFAIASIGSIVGALAASTMRKRLGFTAGFVTGGVLKGMSLALIAVAPTVVAVSALAVSFSFGQTIAAIHANSLRQERTPHRLQGRVTAAYWTLTSAAAPLAATAATWLAKSTGVGPVLLAMGIGSAVLSLLASLSPLRGADVARSLADVEPTPTAE